MNKILKAFGGAGHRSAASVKVENESFGAFEEKILNTLKSCIRIRIFAGDIMSHPVKTVPAGSTITEAKKILYKFRLKGAPVVENKKVIGMITVTDIRKALKNRYGHASVKGYMSRSVITVKPDTPLHTMQRMMFENSVGRLPVMKKGKLVGIVTRTDVLKSVHRDIFRKHAGLRKKRAGRGISAKIKKILPKEIMSILLRTARCADQRKIRAFVVGGFVRDMLLGVKNFDLDIVTESNAISFGRKIAGLLKGNLVIYRKFGTSTVVMDWPKGLARPEGAGTKFKIDFATARKESYKKPAALPVVKFSSLKDDLQRRDFTINAMAAGLNAKNFGQLIDFFGGEKDLEKGVIRVLHDGSFIDDPTRIFRAVRFEQRFGFRIDKYTENLIKGAIKSGMFSRTHHHRIRGELILMLKEEEPLKAILRMKELDELRFIHRKIKVNGTTERLFGGIKSALSWYRRAGFKRRHLEIWLAYLMALFKDLSLSETESLCEKFGFRRIDRERLLSCRRVSGEILGFLSKKRAPSGIYAALKPLSAEEILFIRAGTKKKTVISAISKFLAEYSSVKIAIGGENLKRLGMKPGPVYTKILARVLREKINGKIKNKREELDFVKKHVKGRRS